MRLFFTAALGLLPALPVAAEAQPTPYPRYYLGASLLASDYQRLRADYRGLLLPWQLTLGCQLRPRLAVQASFAYSQEGNSFFSPVLVPRAYRTSPQQYQVLESGSYTQRNTTVALLARYTLTRQAPHRFQVDALGGLTLESRRYSSSVARVYVDSLQTVTGRTQDDTRDDLTNLLLTAGASARYRCGRHLEAVLDGTLHVDVLGRRSGLTSAAALGLRYRFGSR